MPYGEWRGCKPKVYTFVLDHKKSEYRLQNVNKSSSSMGFLSLNPKVRKQKNVS